MIFVSIFFGMIIGFIAGWCICCASIMVKMGKAKISGEFSRRINTGVNDNPELNYSISEEPSFVLQRSNTLKRSFKYMKFKMSNL